MNEFSIIILTALIANVVIGFIADYLNLKHAKTTLPTEFEGIYDVEKYKQSQDYLRVNTRFSWISTAVSLLLLLGFWFLKGFPTLDQAVRSLGYNSIVTGILYIGALVVIRSIISVPFSLYSTFVIETNFGFNTMTFKTYITDLLKSVILGALIGIPLLSGILAFFEYAGGYAWLYCWVTVTVFIILLQYIVPTWIMPLFNKFEPVEEGELKTAIMNYASSIHFTLENIFKMDGSKRSTKSNAFFTGFGKNKRIVLFDTLIQQHTVPELVAVLAHEMGHFKKHHIIKMMVLGVLQTGIVFFIMSLCLTQQGLFDAFFMNQMSVYAGLIFFGLLYAPVDMVVGLLFQIYSRKNEYEADRFAVETTKDKESLISTLKKLSVNNLGNLTPHPFYVFLNYSHPPVLNRIQTIRDATV